MKQLHGILYILICLMAAGIYAAQRLELPLAAWVNNYVNDFLCLPIVLGAITQLVRWIKRDTTFNFPLGFLICMAAYYSFYFEYYLAGSNPRYTSDWIDVVLYFLGALCYFAVSRLDPFLFQRFRSDQTFAKTS